MFTKETIFRRAAFGMSKAGSAASDSLEREINSIFNEIFHVPPKPYAIASYLRFHTVYGPSLRRRKYVDITKIISKNLDLEAIELFLRHCYPGNLLTCKLWVCAYLCEAQQGAPPSGRRRGSWDFVQSPLMCLLMLGWFAIRDSTKWFKGSLQVYRHRLI
jgi:hypothetical protein